MHHSCPENSFSLKFNYNKLQTFPRFWFFKLSKSNAQNESYQRLNEVRFTIQSDPPITRILGGKNQASKTA